MDYAAAVVKLCWGSILEFEKGCFLEISSPEWAQWMKDGDKAPTSPSYCHPWADGVTHWLTESMAGIAPQEPGLVMAYMVMAYIVMAYIVMAYIVMAYIIMAYIWLWPM